MMSSETRKTLIMACQHEVKHAKARYKRGDIDITALRAVNKAMESIQQQIQIEAQKGA